MGTALNFFTGLDRDNEFKFISFMFMFMAPCTADVYQ